MKARGDTNRIDRRRRATHSGVWNLPVSGLSCCRGSPQLPYAAPTSARGSFADTSTRRSPFHCCPSCARYTPSSPYNSRADSRAFPGGSCHGRGRPAGHLGRRSAQGVQHKVASSSNLWHWTDTYERCADGAGRRSGSAIRADPPPPMPPGTKLTFCAVRVWHT